MITFSRFGSHGRFGNQLFQWASLIGLSRKFGTGFSVPKWKYSRYFATPPAVTSSVHRKADLSVTESHYHYDPKFLESHREAVKSKTVDVLGWLQSERYWEDRTFEVRETMAFSELHIKDVKRKYGKIFETEVPIIAISVRRGDYVDNVNYHQLPIRYYLTALFEHFPDYRKKMNLMIFSDDMDYCRIHFSGLPNVVFAHGDPAEQLCAMSLCDHFIIANSTFSWWGAYLGEKPHSKIIRPAYHFDGEMEAKNDWGDYYPSRWTRHDHADKRLDLRDVTFTIPFKWDHDDRRANLWLAIDHIQENFETNILVGEQGDHEMIKPPKVNYHHFDGMTSFHRTKMLNDMANMSTTPIIVNWDADVLIPPAQILQAADRIRNGKAQMVYPYDGRFARVPRTHYGDLRRTLDVGVLGSKEFKGMRQGDALSVGGAIMWNKEAFISGGMENEGFISYGPEDVERFERFQRLGFQIESIKGVLFHVDHFIGKDSGQDHPHFKLNAKLLERIRSMKDEQLRKEVKSFPWLPKYTAGYYETIFERAVQSRDEIFKAFRFQGEEKARIIDVGCGIGEFGHEMMEKFGFEYFGVDYQLPREKLLIPLDHYAEFNLEKDFVDFPFKQKFDLVICTEVVEHIDKLYAVRAIQTLTSLGDVVLFSAAIPGQGGHHHVNEQWQSYWAEIFKNFGFSPSLEDYRIRIWNDERIDVWYRQNIVVYVKDEAHQNFVKNHHGRGKWELDIVHPQMFLNHLKSKR